jgi:hypothetical protein
MLLLLLLLALPEVVQAQFTYTTNNGTITITGYTGPGGAVTIPGTINGLPVGGIGDYAFWGAGASLSSVTIPKSVTNIGTGPFASCTGLIAITVDALNPAYCSVGGVLFNKSQTMLIQCPGGKIGSYSVPNSVTSIADAAFFRCTSLTDVMFADSVISIGDGAFNGCSSLFTISIPNSVTNIGYSAFYECTSLTSVTIGNKLTSIADQAFESCASLTNATIGANVASIGVEAFLGCGSLANVMFPSSVTSIGTRAFCFTSLANVTIPNSVTSIGTEAFARCDMLSAITVGALNAVYRSADGVLFDKSQTTLIQYPAAKAGSYSVPNSVTIIGEFAFENCANLTNVTIGTSVTSIEDYAFGGCSSLSNVTIPNGVTNIGIVAFGRTSLTSVVIPNSVTRLGLQAFYDCENLTNAMIGTGVTTIEYGAFGCLGRLSAISVDALNPAFSSVAGVLFDKNQTTLLQFPGGKAGGYTLPSSVTGIGSFAFEASYSLTNVTILNGVTNIGDGAFRYCGSLTGVTISDRVTSVGLQAFRSCSGLTSVTLPSSVASIGEEAFSSCYSLTGVYFKGDAPSLGGPSVFAYDDNATVYYLPGTTGWGTTFGGRPTALWPPPTIQTSPLTQTAEAGSAVGLRVKASSLLPLFYLWYLNATNLLSYGTNWQLDLPSVQFAQSGAYTVVISNVLGAVTSAPAMLQVVAAVERRPVPGVKVTGEAGSLWNVDYADSLSPPPNWTPLGSVSLTGTPQYCCDPTLPLPPQRFYRAWQTGTPGVMPSVDLHLVPAITLTGTIGHSVRLDYINQFGPMDAWTTLATVPLTNTSQLYFDISAPGQPPRLYRLVASP